MARYIQLLKNNEPVSFSLIDEAICKHFDAPVHPKKYYSPSDEISWYDALGWSTSSSLDEEIANCSDEPDLAAVYQFLKDEGYALSAWSGR
jgi:hypothetical protein